MRWFMWRHCETLQLLLLVSVPCRFGHHDKVTAVDCLMRERPISSGGNDQSVRLWKVIEETQLVFQGHKLVQHLCVV